MKIKTALLFLIIFSILSNAQKIKLTPLLKDQISIRAIQIWDGKVWYSGTDSKFGFVDLKDPKDQKQIKLSDEKLQFRTLAQNRQYFYAINIESPAQFFQIDKKTLQHQIVYRDTLKSAFYDALHFHEGNFYTFSDPEENLELKFFKFYVNNDQFESQKFSKFVLNKGEAAFAASNTNIASYQKWVWIATGGMSSRILKINLKTKEVKPVETPFIQETGSQGMYSIDFYKDKFGIAVGGDYTKQDENLYNITTTTDGGESWQIQASGKNAGYTTCVKIRPGSKGKEIISVGDQHISYSRDYGKTWIKISDEKGFYVCEWIDKNRIAFAGKDKVSVGNIFSIVGK